MTAEEIHMKGSLHVLGTFLLKVQGKCHRWNHLCFVFALPVALKCSKLFLTPVHQAISIENQQLLLVIPERYPSYNLGCLSFSATKWTVELRCGDFFGSKQFTWQNYTFSNNNKKTAVVSECRRTRGFLHARGFKQLQLLRSSMKIRIYNVRWGNQSDGSCVKISVSNF